MSLVETDLQPAPQPREGADLVLDAFLRHQVKPRLHLSRAAPSRPILDRIEKRSSIEIVCPRTEQGAGYAALAYARMTGQTAVFMVTSGPGVTNAVTPVADAYYDNIPLVVITGQVGTADMRGDLPVKQRGFQEVDTVALMKPITKAAFLVKDVARTARCAGTGFLPGAQRPPGPGGGGPADECAARRLRRSRADRQAHRGGAVCARRQDRDPGAMDRRSRAAGDSGRRRRDRVRRAEGAARAGRQISHSRDHEHAGHGRLSVGGAAVAWACAAMPAASMPTWPCTRPIF